MIIFKKASDLKNYLQNQRQKQVSTGFVPTMGALHEGHLSLIRNSKRENDLSVCSIFVNPTQFNDPSDFEKYPITIEEDIYALETTSCDILFLPDVEEVYPNGTNQVKQYNFGYLDKILEGEFRPGHFQGVCMVVERLLELVQPTRLYLGQKDFQQCMVIKKLAELMQCKAEIKVCPTLREADGLAMSSRNKRLSSEDRAKAVTIYQTLLFLKDNIDKGALSDLKKLATKKLKQNGFRPDYVEIVDPKTLKPLNEWDSRQGAVGLIAAYLNEVRLIDNMVLCE
ncbi:MAG: pantoate--beta-alanine ligase [Chitinophagaceae bacterium]